MANNEAILEFRDLAPKPVYVRLESNGRKLAMRPPGSLTLPEMARMGRMEETMNSLDKLGDNSDDDTLTKAELFIDDLVIMAFEPSEDVSEYAENWTVSQKIRILNFYQKQLSDTVPLDESEETSEDS